MSAANRMHQVYGGLLDYAVESRTCHQNSEPHWNQHFELALRGGAVEGDGTFRSGIGAADTKLLVQVAPHLPACLLSLLLAIPACLHQAAHTDLTLTLPPDCTQPVAT